MALQSQAFDPQFLSAFKTRADPSVHPITLPRRQVEERYGPLLKESEKSLGTWGSLPMFRVGILERCVFFGDMSQVPWEGCLSSASEAGSVISHSLREAMSWKQQSPWAMLKSEWKWNNGALHSIVTERVQAWCYISKCFSVGGKLSRSVTAKWANKRALFSLIKRK